MGMFQSGQHLGAAVFAGLAVFAADAAMGGEPWVRIEEDWELKIYQPSEETNSPQLTIYLTPDKDRLDTYFQLQLNHAADADFSGGGFRVSALQHDWSVDEARSQTRNLLSVDGDVVRWTSVMVVYQGEILFAIKDGDSQSWGTFGGPEYLLRMPSEGLTDLSRYTPQQSVNDVDIGFGSNRVESLKLKRVRAYRADGSFVNLDVELDAS